MIAAIAGSLARRQTARPMAGCGSERSFVGRSPAAIVVQVPAVSIGVLEGAGTTLTIHSTALRLSSVGKTAATAIGAGAGASARCGSR
jgi:hypothetical protein